MIRFTGPDDMSEPITRQEMYSDGTPRIKTQGWERIVRKADAVVVQANSLMEFVNAMFLVDAIDTYSESKGITKLVLPYIPGARQDRSNPTGDVLFTLASVADMINVREFSEVIVLDPHSPVSEKAIHRMREYPLENVVKQIPTRYDGIIAPDKGARDRAKRVADFLNVPLYLGGKARDVATGKLTGFTLENLNYDNMRPNGHYLVVDDICDGGGTFIGLAEKIYQQYATADLYVSHGIFSKGFDALDKAFKNVYTTDSFAGRCGSTKVIPVVKDMENF
jgi:ribose-phosphate pyrophosphokinase